MKKTIAFVMAIMMVMTLFAGCGAKNEPAAEANVIKIGLTGPLTGGAAVYGTAVEAAMKIAVEEINAAAGEGDLKIEFKSADDEHDPEKALNAYNSLKDWGMQIFAGSVTTAPALALAPETVADNIFMLTPSASAPEVATAGSNVFQICFTDPNQGAGSAGLIAEKKLGETIGVIYDSSDAYSTGIYESFMADAEKLGLNVAVVTSFTGDNKNDLSTQVAQCKDAGCDLVFLPFYATEAAQVLTYANKVGYAPMFFGCDGMDGILTVEGFDANLAEGLVMMTPFAADAADEKTQSFVKKYKEMMNGETPNQFAADGYDVIYSLYEACKDSGINGSESNKAICDAMIKWFATNSFDGLTGSGMTWDAEGLVSKVPTAVVVHNGVYVGME